MKAGAVMWNASLRFLIYGLVFLLPIVLCGPVSAKAERPWCSTALPKRGGIADVGYVNLPRAAAILVDSKMQKQAMSRLALTSYEPLSKKDAMNYIDANVSTGDGRFFLVRAGSLYIDPWNISRYGKDFHPFDVYYNKKTKSLALINPALGVGGVTPNNVAVVVFMNPRDEIKNTESYCIFIAQ